MTDYKETAQEMLAAVDAFMAGEDMTNSQLELHKAVTTAGAFAAAAFEAHSPRSGGEYHALTRAFLVALKDPSNSDLDYLRAGALLPCPFCGETPETERAAFSKMFRIVCENCEFEMQKVTKAQAVTTWNSRAKGANQ